MNIATTEVRLISFEYPRRVRLKIASSARFSAAYLAQCWTWQLPLTFGSELLPQTVLTPVALVPVAEQGGRAVVDAALGSCSQPLEQLEDPMTGAEYGLRASLLRACMAQLEQASSGIEALALQNEDFFRNVVAAADLLRQESHAGLRKAFQCVSASGRLLRANRPGAEVLPAIRTGFYVALNISGQVRDRVLAKLSAATEAKA